MYVLYVVWTDFFFTFFPRLSRKGLGCFYVRMFKSLCSILWPGIHWHWRRIRVRRTAKALYVLYVVYFFLSSRPRTDAPSASGGRRFVYCDVVVPPCWLIVEISSVSQVGWFMAQLISDILKFRNYGYTGRTLHVIILSWRCTCCSSSLVWNTARLAEFVS